MANISKKEIAFLTSFNCLASWPNLALFFRIEKRRMKSYSDVSNFSYAIFIVCTGMLCFISMGTRKYLACNESQNSAFWWKPSLTGLHGGPYLIWFQTNVVCFNSLQPQNLLLTGAYPDCDIKLCDFGISRVIRSGVEVREILGTPDYVGMVYHDWNSVTRKWIFWDIT